MLEVFAVQEDIATKIAAQLDLTLLASDKKVLAERPTKDSKAYDYYLKGMNELKREFQGNMYIAAANLDSAVMTDPSFALAHAAKSRAHTLLGFGDPKGEHAKIAREAFEKALQLQPDLAHGHLAAGTYYSIMEEDYDKALASLDLAVSELSGDVEVLTSIAMVQWRKGMIAEPEENFRKACELDPLNSGVHARLSGFLGYLRMYSEAEQSINRAIGLEPKFTSYYWVKLGIVNNGYGDWQKSRNVVREALRSVDSSEYFGIMFPDVSAIFGLNLDSLLGIGSSSYVQMADSGRRMHQKFLDSLRQVKSPELATDSANYYFRWSISETYRAAGNAALAKVYLDSAVMAARYRVKTVPTDFHATSHLGLLLAQSGSCKEGIEYGQRGIDLLSLDKCHW
jgi:Tfp pilus assembly protein PilF